MSADLPPLSSKADEYARSLLSKAMPVLPLDEEQKELVISLMRICYIDGSMEGLFRLGQSKATA